MKLLNSNELKEINGSFVYPRDKYSIKECSRAGIYVRPHIFRKHEYFASIDGKIVKISREDAMISTFLKLDRPDMVAKHIH